MHLIAALLLSSLQAQAQRQAKQEHPIHEEYEVLSTKTGYTLPAMVLDGDVILAHWGDFGDFRNSGVDVDITQLQFEGAFGITPWVTAELEIPFVWVDPDPGSSESGLGDIAIDGKASVMKDLSPIGFVDFPLAFGTRISLPTGDDKDGTGEENATLRPYVAGGYRITPWVDVQGEVSLEWQSERRPVHRFNVAADFTPWAPDLSLLAGLNFYQFGGDTPEAMFVPGVEYRMADPKIWFGAGLPFGLTSDAPNWGIVLNVQIRLGPFGN